MRPVAGAVLLASLFLPACTDHSAESVAREIEQGRVLYAANGCGTCHGLTGRGDGPVATTLSPPPRDFRDAAAFKNGVDTASVANTIATGLARDGGQMQSYFHLSGRERHLLARFVISLRESPPGAAPASPLTLTDAWVREPVPGRPMTAAYAVVKNNSGTDLHITAVTADVAGTVELHEMVRTGDIMTMAPVKGVTVPANGMVELRPGGLHLMLFELKRPLKDGDTVTLTFTTSAGGAVKATATVRRAQVTQ